MGNDDPALRALLTNRQVPDANSITITVGELRALAAAEAAPLDVERLAYALNRAFGATPLGTYNEIAANPMKSAERLAREYAALRPLDTETADGFVVCPLCHEPERTEDMVAGVCLSCADAIAYAQNARRGAVYVE